MTYLLCTTKMPSFVSPLNLSRSATSTTADSCFSISDWSSRIVYLWSEAKYEHLKGYSTNSSPRGKLMWIPWRAHDKVVRVSSTSSTTKIRRPSKPPWLKFRPSWVRPSA